MSCMQGNTRGKDSDKRGDRRFVASFVMPNDRIDPGMPLTAFTVPLENLETAAGLRFFPGVLDVADRRALDEGALKWQKGEEHSAPLPSSTRSCTWTSLQPDQQPCLDSVAHRVIP